MPMFYSPPRPHSVSGAKALCSLLFRVGLSFGRRVSLIWKVLQPFFVFITLLKTVGWVLCGITVSLCLFDVHSTQENS